MTEEEFLRSLGAWECLQDNPHHIYSVGEHTEKVVAWCKAHGGSDEVIRAAWLHDCGKMSTKRRRNVKGTWIDTFYGHAAESARLAKGFGEPEYITELIRCHDITIGGVSDQTIQRLAAKGERWCADLELLMTADLAGQHPTYHVKEKKAERSAFLKRLHHALERSRRASMPAASPLPTADQALKA